MDIPLSEKRQIENEMIFRRANEKVGIALEDINTKHVEDGNPDLVTNDDLLLHFICECSDENCKERIPMKLSVYQKIHLNRGLFIIMPNHQVEAIEKVVYSEPTYSVVEKNNYISEPGKILNDTMIDNS
jgi:hypothetical protein